MKKENKFGKFRYLKIDLLILSIVAIIVFFGNNLTYGILLIIMGLIGIFFNKFLYNYKVKYLYAWKLEKSKFYAPQVKGGIKSSGSRKAFRILFFIVGVIALIIGILFIFKYLGIDLGVIF